MLSLAVSNDTCWSLWRLKSVKLDSGHHVTFFLSNEMVTRLKLCAQCYANHACHCPAEVAPRKRHRNRRQGNGGPSNAMLGLERANQ